MKEIYNLIDSYFSGETSAEEEKQLREFFTHEQVPNNLQDLKAIFAYFEDEKLAREVLNEIKEEEKHSAKTHNKSLRSIVLLASSVAAAIIAFIAINTNVFNSNNTHSENYVWVNGEQITDTKLVMQYAQKSFTNVQTENDIVEQQLQSMFE